jgi:mannose-6-phosphate isomerase
MEIPGVIALPPNRVWRTYFGGRILDELSGKADAVDEHFPEDWIASTTLALNPGREEATGEGLSRVEVCGKTYTLKELMENYPEPMLGSEHVHKYGAVAQLLVKLLDSGIRLPLQAHPTSEFARARLGSASGKTEAYVILECRAQPEPAFIYLGFQHPLPRKSFARAVQDQDIDTLLSCFEKIPVRAGDVFVVPGGLPHAIGAGIFMIEIMEPTDFVARLEFTVGSYVLPESARFMGRDVGFAMDMIDFSPRPVEQVRRDCFCVPRVVSRQGGGTESVLIDRAQTTKFSVSRLHVTGRFLRRSSGFSVGIVTRGAGKAVCGKSELGLKRGDRFVVPSQTREIELTAGGAGAGLEIVLAFPPA